jgi:microcystin-dependent protein
MTLLPTPWPADPVEGEPGHFDHTLWVKASLIALDGGKITTPGGTVPAGKVLGTTAENTWGAIDPSAIGVVPSGAILAYHGVGIPSGWALCDGTNGTPDLRDRFIVGASATKTAGSVGGQESVTLTAAQSGLPAHTHTTASADAAHSHDMTDTNLAHSHGMDYSGSHAHGGKWLPWVADQNVTAGLGAYATKGGNGHDVIGMDGSHIHTVHSALGNHKHSILSGNATHSHNVNPNTAANASQAHSNMPPYYALVYIMKL